MGFYCEHQGTIKFKKKEQYLEFKKTLIDGGWASEENWLCEMGSPLSDEYPFSDDLLEVEFDGSTQRNIHRVIDKLKNYEWEGLVTGAATDGCFEGWILQGNEKEIYVDLEDFAEEKGLDRNRPNSDKNPEAYLDWQYHVIEKFHFDPFVKPANSVVFITEDIKKEQDERHISELFKK